jgi:methanogenic corrinoid protein MtbC1
VYTIKQAAARSGLSIPTIRAWERRYGVISPERTSAGYRLYDDASITRLRAMRQLVETEGWRPSQAAIRVIAGGPEIDALGEDSRGLRTAAPPPAGAREATGGTIDAPVGAVERFVAAARQLDVTTMEAVLDDAFAVERFERAMERVVFPALHAIGESWSVGELDVAMEHAASETVRRRLAHFFDAAGHADRSPGLIVGMPPAGQHELGAFAFAVAARRQGLDVLYLGADVPLASWLTAAEETAASVVVIGVVTSADAESAGLVLDALRRSARPPRRAVGGAASGRVSTDGTTIVLPDRLDGAVDVVAGLLA